MNVAMFGGFSKTPLPPGWKRQTALAIFGGGDLDLSASGPADDARLTAIAILGGIDVRVPPGTRVALSGVSLLGGRDVQVEPGDGPTIRVRAFAVLGGVTIRSAGESP
jgi:hypothetical protein